MSKMILQADGTIVLAASTTTTGSATTTAGEVAGSGTHGATEGVGASPGAHGAAKVFPPLDPTTFAPQLVWFALTFGVFYLLLSRVALPRVSSVIEARAAHIKSDLDEAERLKADTDKALAEYEKALADAKGKANGIAQQTRDTLKTYVDQQRAHADKENTEKTAAAEAQIATAKQAALSNVGTIAAETAEAILSRLIKAPVSRDEINAVLNAMRAT